MRRRKNSPLTSKPLRHRWSDSPANHRGDGGYWEAVFDVPALETGGQGKDEVVVTMSLYSVPGSKDPDERAIEVAFMVDGAFHTTGGRGTALASRIFATSVKVVEEFIEKSPWKISSIFFTSTMAEPSRVKMYDTMARLLSRRLSQGHGVPVYLVAQDDSTGHRRYVITTRDPSGLLAKDYYVMDTHGGPLRTYRWNPK